MRKCLMNEVVRVVKKEQKRNMPNLNPTLEECDYLYSKGINTTKGYELWTTYYTYFTRLYDSTICSLEK